MPTALIVDASADTLVQLSRVFRKKGYSTETSQSFASAREALLRRMPEIAVINESIDGERTLGLLAELDLSRVMEIYLISDKPTLETATEAMRVGVSDYFEKPVDEERLASNLDELVRQSAGAGESELASDKSGHGLLVGESASMRRLTRLIRKVAPNDAAVLFAGESGTGKELAARTLHALSARAAGPFVALNCSAVTQELMESELFGHVKGSFTGATRHHKGYFRRADSGTLFLDEITELDAALQAKLLRALETRVITPVGGEKEISVDVRIVSATNRDPREAVEQGLLREDLYFRLAQFPIRVPPLRERGSDVELLARHFLAEQNEERGLDKQVSDDVIDLLKLHDWPGNVRELRNAIIHGHLLAGEEIGTEDLPDHIPETGTHQAGGFRAPIGMTLAEVERRHTLATLAHYGGEKKRTAEVLGISLKTLYNRLKKYGVH